MPATVAYLSHDEVNTALAGRMADRLGLPLDPLTVREAGRAAAADLLVLDLDHLPADYRAELLRARGRAVRAGVAVHSYHLTTAQARALRAVGVRVARRLTAAVLARPVPAGRPA